jgi:Bacterial regulatory protein, arsR family
MKITTVPRKTSTLSVPLPPDWREHYAWDDLAIRLIDPIKLAIIETLLQLRQPLAISDLAAILGISDDLARYHCKALTRVEVVEVVEVQIRLDGSGGEEPFFDVPLPPQGSSTSSSVPLS